MGRRRAQPFRPWSVDYKDGDEAGRTYALAPRKPKRKTETALTREIMVALNRLPGVHVFRNNTGALTDGGGRLVYYGLGTGSPDLVGWMTVVHGCLPIARFLGVEVKVAGRETAHPETLENQDRWRDMINSAGGMYIRVTSVGDAIAAVI